MFLNRLQQIHVGSFHDGVECGNQGPPKGWHCCFVTVRLLQLKDPFGRAFGHEGGGADPVQT